MVGDGPAVCDESTSGQVGKGSLYWAASQLGLPTLADGGYHGAGIGVHTPAKTPPHGRLDPDTATRNLLLRSLRCPGERGFALLTQRWRVLQHVTVSPRRIGDIAQAALCSPTSSTAT